MINVGLHSPDKTDFPNLALMKLSAWHKAKGDMVSFYGFGSYDKVYSSKVFTYSPSIVLPDNAITGGTGNSLTTTLPEEIEHTCPDYSLYNLNYSMGFVTRGCNRKCEHCFVPAKEGGIKAHTDVDEFLRHKELVLLDNNILANDHGLEQLEKIARLGVKIDINQGIDARLIDTEIAKLFSRIKWRSPVRLACDSMAQIEPVRKAVELLRWYNVKPMAYQCYVLIKDIPDALERLKFLKGMAVDPFAQPYIDIDGTPPTKEQRRLARWVNHKATFKSVVWEDYK